jgi:hypothetical protein
MPITNGQRMALYLLLSTQSELRATLEGRVKVDPALKLPVFSNVVTTPIIDANDLVTRMGRLLLKQFKIDITNAATPLPNLDKLFDNTATNKVTTDSLTIRHALDMSGPYPDTDPCPTGLDQYTLFQVISASIV